MSEMSGPRLTRRTLLRAGGLAALAGATVRRNTVLNLGVINPASTIVTGTTFDLVVVRPLDGLRLSLQFNNVDVVAGELRAAAGVSWFAVVFPSQHIQENSVPVGTLNNDPTSRAARASRLVFDVTDPIPFTLDTLLDFPSHTLRLDPRAIATTSNAVPSKPTDDVTSLVLPEGLWLTPAQSEAAFKRRVQFTLDDTTEVFVVRMGQRHATDPTRVLNRPVDVRALWTPGYADGAIVDVNDGFPLSGGNKKRIVRATSHYGDDDYPNHEPAVASLLWLTSAGGSLDIAGEWDSTAQLVAWEHQIRTGRDTFVKIVSRGYLLPFGHLATVIEVTERTFVIIDDAVTTQLETSTYLSINTSTQSIPTDLMDDEGRGFPFVSATLVDSGLHTVTKVAIPGVASTDAAFLAEVDGEPLVLGYSLDDRVDANVQAVAISFPAIWVGADHAFGQAANGVLADVVDWLSDDALTDDLRTIDFGGARIGYTDETSEGSGRTTFQTDTQRWTFERPVSGTNQSALKSAGFPAIFPRLAEARVASPALDALLGLPTTFVDVTLDTAWLQFGNLTGVGENPLVNALELKVPRTIAFDELGSGIAKPTFRADIFNQTLGFAPADLVPNANFDVLDFLGTLPKLLGVLDLGDLLSNVIQSIPSSGFGEVPTIPGFQIDVEFDGNIPSKVTATFHWETELASYDAGTSTEIFEVSAVEPGAPTLLAVDAFVCVPLDGSDPDAQISVAVDNFAISFPPNFELIRVSFHEIRLSATPGDGVELVPDLEQIRFEGVLTLLEALQPLLQFQGGGLELEERDDDVQALVRISLPNISLGILAIRNISIAAGANIPLVPSKQFESIFEFGTKSNPVTVLVLGYGGGFHLELTGAPYPGSVELIRLGINVTFEQSLNVVVAKGTLSASFGAYLEISGPALNLTVVLGAYVEVTGSVKVLGVVTITIGASVELTYNLTTQILKGTATIYASVDTPLGSKEVSFKVKQEIKIGSGGGNRKAPLGRTSGRVIGSPGHPVPGIPGGSLGGDGDDTVATLADRYDQRTWQAYCDAFGDTR